MKLNTRTLFAALLIAMPALVSTQTLTGQTRETRNEEEPLPGWNIKTNLLYDLTTTFNLGVEFRTGGKTSVEIPFNYNPWEFRNGTRKAKHFLVQPEFRYWLKETFRGHFFGLQGHYGIYNAGGWPHGPFSQYMADNRFQGWLAGAGVGYGYRWNFNYRWAIEAEIGVGYAYMDYDRYLCHECGEPQGADTKHYFGPTEAAVNLIFGIGRKPEPKTAFAPPPVYQPAFAASFVVPEVEAVKARSEAVKTYLEFEVDKSEIVSGFGNNASELEKIASLDRSVKGNSDATITGGVITGYASPEGTVKHNQTLSEARAQSLLDYLKANHSLPVDDFTVKGAGEDWAGLEALVEKSDIAQKDRILTVIRKVGTMEGREGELKNIADGSPYREMLEEMFPELRRVEYQLDYTVAPFSVEKGKEVIETRPGTLSLNEMFLIANTYEPGSRRFNEVFETAAEVFPDNDIANLNAAATALARKDANAAASYLGKVKQRSAEYWNNAGMLAWLQGDKAAAVENFKRAGSAGSTNAAELDKHLRSLSN